MEDSDAVDSLLSLGLYCPQCWLLFVVSGCVVVALAVAGILVGVPRNLSRAVPGSLPQRRLNSIKKPLTAKYYTHVFDYFYVDGMS